LDKLRFCNLILVLPVLAETRDMFVGNHLQHLNRLVRMLILCSEITQSSEVRPFSSLVLNELLRSQWFVFTEVCLNLFVVGVACVVVAHCHCPT